MLLDRYITGGAPDRLCKISADVHDLERTLCVDLVAHGTHVAFKFPHQVVSSISLIRYAPASARAILRSTDDLNVR